MIGGYPASMSFGSRHVTFTPMQSLMVVFITLVSPLILGAIIKVWYAAAKRKRSLADQCETRLPVQSDNCPITPTPYQSHLGGLLDWLKLHFLALSSIPFSLLSIFVHDYYMSIHWHPESRIKGVFFLSANLDVLYLESFGLAIIALCLSLIGSIRETHGNEVSWIEFVSLLIACAAFGSSLGRT